MNKYSDFLVRLSLLALAMVLSVPVSAQQRYPDFSGVDAKRFNPGGVSSFGSGTFSQGFGIPGGYGYGSYYSSQNWGLGGPGFYSQFGGLSYGTTPLMNYGCNPSGFGWPLVPGRNYYYSSGPVASTVLMNNSFSLAPWGFSGFPGGFNYGWSGWGYDGLIPTGWIADPFTGLILPIQPYSSWYICSLPYYGGVNPYYSATVLAPTVLSINLSMQPASMTAPALALTDPRILDLVAPAPRQAAGQNPGNVAAAAGNAVAAPAADPAVPLLNEFAAMPQGQHQSTLADRIHSLRYQSAGDHAFRNADYASAELFYKSALDLAPDRRAVWLRMAFVQIASGQFHQPAGFLKTGLLIPEDSTRSWVSAEELYGVDGEHKAQTHADALWNWLSDRPMSSDRLLLAGAFQELRGFHQMADEVLKLARHNGDEEARVIALQGMAAADPGHRAAAEDLARILQQHHSLPVSAPTATEENISFDPGVRSAEDHAVAPPEKPAAAGQPE